MGRADRHPTGVPPPGPATRRGGHLDDLRACTRTDAGEPLAAALRTERAAELRRGVAALPEPYRETVALRFYGDLALDEIARATGRPLNTVKTHLRRGLERLRDTVGAEGSVS